MISVWIKSPQDKVKSIHDLCRSTLDLTGIADGIFDDINEGFQSNIHSGSVTPPLEDSTRDRKKRLGKPEHPLEFSGELMNSLQMTEKSPNRIVIDSTVPYSIFHWSWETHNKLPRRDPLTNKVIKRIVDERLKQIGRSQKPWA